MLSGGAADSSSASAEWTLPSVNSSSFSSSSSSSSPESEAAGSTGCGATFWSTVADVGDSDDKASLGDAVVCIAAGAGDVASWGNWS